MKLAHALLCGHEWLGTGRAYSLLLRVCPSLLCCWSPSLPRRTSVYSSAPCLLTWWRHLERDCAAGGISCAGGGEEEEAVKATQTGANGTTPREKRLPPSAPDVANGPGGYLRGEGGGRTASLSTAARRV